MHDALAAWPWAAEVLTADGFVGLLGDSALWMVESIVAGAVDAGCTHEQAVDVFRSIWYYTVGEILVRAHSPPPQDGRTAPPASTPSSATLDARSGTRTWPPSATSGPRWPRRTPTPQGLRAFVDGLLAQSLAETSGTANSESS